MRYTMFCQKEITSDGRLGVKTYLKNEDTQKVELQDTFYDEKARDHFLKTHGFKKRNIKETKTFPWVKP